MLIGISRWAGAQEPIDFQDHNKAIAASVLSVVNTERTRQGLGAVSENEVLQNAAQWMADDMAAHDTLDHTDSQHRSFAKRLQRATPDCVGADYRATCRLRHSSCCPAY
ncbi:CAP domain-containing protein [Nitrospira sp. Nam74]